MPRDLWFRLKKKTPTGTPKFLATLAHKTESALDTKVKTLEDLEDPLAIKIQEARTAERHRRTLSTVRTKLREHFTSKGKASHEADLAFDSAITELAEEGNASWCI